MIHMIRMNEEGNVRNIVCRNLDSKRKKGGETRGGRRSPGYEPKWSAYSMYNIVTI